ncbi:MAG: RagB/SusD family nutrient uptake outer membrane protein, partial [Bacteroidales bacterium]|nr:RagB/SusD family nutrient uptake outer membrane protein [Bacteroidales bacterium]
HYFDLVRTYGGVPLLLHEQEATSNIEDLQTPRAKTSECVEQIIKDLNAAIALPDASFPMKRNDGHIGKGVAYALKGKVLLYYASPQFTRQTPAGTKPAEQRWNEAYTACKVAYDSLKTAGFGLYAEEGGDRAKVMENYYKMLVTEEMNKEMIWVRRYEPLINNNQIDQRFRPSSSGGSSVNVTLEFVNAFANNDGTPFTGFPIDYSKDGSKVLGDITQGAIVAGGSPTGPDGDAVNRTAFWVDREPRFYAFINYNGCEFPLIRRNSSALSGDVDATGKMKHGWIFCWGANGNLDPFDNGFENTNNRGQGFTIRKFISDDRDYSATGTSPLKECGTDWPLFRFAEVMLNYAEAAAKTGHPDEAYAVLDALRKRAGILPGNNYGLGRKTGDALMLDILNERRIELAFESQRYYDLRRWDLFAGGLSGYKLNGLQRHAVQTWVKDGNEKAANVNEMVSRVNGILTAGGIDTPAGRDAYFDVFYHTVMLYDTEPVHYNPDRQDFLRIPYTAHIQKNPLIEQTIGWTDDRSAGTFNPYE